MATAQELPIDTSASALAMAQEIFGNGASIVSASYTGDSRSSGIFTDGDSAAPEVTPSDRGVILSTGRAGDITNESNGWPWGGNAPWWWNSGSDPNESDSTSTNTSGPDNNAQFNAAAGSNTFDAAWLDVDFIPTGDTLSMQFIFASEEYPEFTSSIYQDFVGVWVNGQQVETEVGLASPNNINDTQNQNLFIDNTGGDYNTEMDGFTVTMTLKMKVIPDEVNSIRIGIADVSDNQYDSNLLIAAESVQTTLSATADMVEIYPDAVENLDVLANDENGTGGTLTITHINGNAVSAGDEITLPTGQQIKLNADGTIDIAGDGEVENVNFTYTVASSTGQTDTGYVLVDSVPCFVAGTRIATPDGARRVERLMPGDLVLTRDEGAQPLRWVGRRQVPAEGAFAPIRIAAGTFGQHGELRLSPLHRVLIRDVLAELLFGESEVLVAARDLVNDRSVRPEPGGMVDYVHLLFDRHQVVWSEGLETESFLPGPQIANSFEREIVDEIRTLFPEIDPETGAGYSPAARRALKSFEARLLAGLAA
ncbi:MAG: Hint domain-containing protein [Paracoccaceae bacterium]